MLQRQGSCNGLGGFSQTGGGVQGGLGGKRKLAFETFLNSYAYARQDAMLDKSLSQVPRCEGAAAEQQCSRAAEQQSSSAAVQQCRLAPLRLLRRRSVRRRQCRLALGARLQLLRGSCDWRIAAVAAAMSCAELR